MFTGEKNRWWLFDRQVESPHTTSFYVERPANSTASAYDQESFAEVSARSVIWNYVLTTMCRRRSIGTMASSGTRGTLRTRWRKRGD